MDEDRSSMSGNQDQWSIILSLTAEEKQELIKAWKEKGGRID